MLDVRFADPDRLARLMHATSTLVSDGAVVRRAVVDSGLRSISGLVTSSRRNVELLTAISGSIGASAAERTAAELATIALEAGITSARRGAEHLRLATPSGPFGRSRTIAGAARHLAESATHTLESRAHLARISPETIDDAAARLGNFADAPRSTAIVDAPVAPRWASTDPTRSQRALLHASRPLRPSVVAVDMHRAPGSGALHVAPHGSNLDAFHLGSALPESGGAIRFLTNGKLVDAPVIGKLARAGGAVPVHRGRSEEALGELAAMLHAGQRPVVFPEGRMVYAPAVGEAFEGAVRVALSTGADIAPIGIAGAKPRWATRERWFGRPPVVVVHGQPVRAPLNRSPSGVDVHALTEQAWRAVDDATREAERVREQLRPAAQRRAAARVAAGAGAAALGWRIIDD